MSGNCRGRASWLEIAKLIRIGVCGCICGKGLGEESECGRRQVNCPAHTQFFLRLAFPTGLLGKSRGHSFDMDSVSPMSHSFKAHCIVFSHLSPRDYELGIGFIMSCCYPALISISVCL